MPPRPTLRIAEIFASAQGEGQRLGEPTIFVRLAGCNLRCRFCDTKAAWRGGRPMSPELVLSAARRLRRTWPADWICLTGGEPTLQDLGPLAGLLRADGWKVQIETNGTIWTPVPADWITISPKPPGFDVHPRMIGKAREIKLVVTRALAFADVVRVRNAFPARAPLYLQPESNAGWSRAKAERFYHRAVREGLAGMRLGIQLHRIYGFR